MRRTNAIVLAGGALLLAPLLSGCDADVRATVAAGDRVTVHAELWDRDDTKFDLQRGDCPSVATLTAEALDDPSVPGRFGCRYTGTLTLGEGVPLIAGYEGVRALHAEQRYFVEGRQTVFGAVDEDRSVAAPGKVHIEVTFPGPVMGAGAGGVVQGNTVTWTDVEALTSGDLEAVALDAGQLTASSLVVPGGLLGAVVGLAVAVAWPRRQTRRETAPQAPAPGEAESGEAESDDPSVWAPEG